MAEDAVTPEPPPPSRTASGPNLPSPASRSIAHARDEDAPRRNRLQVWNARTGCTLAATCLGGALAGLLAGAAIGGNMPNPLDSIVLALTTLLASALAGLAQYLYTRNLPGNGERIVNRELPSFGASSAETSGSAGSSQFTTAPRPARPLRHVEKLRGSGRPLTSVAISPDARLALGGNRAGRVILWDVETGFELFSQPAYPFRATAAAVSPDGSLLAAAGLSRNRQVLTSVVHIWDAASGQELRRIEIAEGLYSLSFLPDSRQLLLGGLNHLRLWELNGPTPVALIPLNANVFTHHELRALAVAFDGKIALAGGSDSKKLWLVNLDSGEKVRALIGHGEVFTLVRAPAVTSVAFSPDGLRAVSGSLDRTARVWSVLSGETLRTIRGHGGWWGWRGVVGVAWMPDGQRVVTAGEDGTLRVWSVEDGSELERREHGGTITCLAVSPDGRLALTGGSDGIVRVHAL